MTEIVLTDIAGTFAIEGEIAEVKPLGEGFINDTFTIATKSGQTPDYILQRKNKNIFKDVPGMMNNILIVTEHLKKKISEAGGDHMREALTVVPTKDGRLYHKDANGDFWAACTLIGDTVAHNFADTPELAYQGGYGIGKFQAMLSDLKTPLADILPGFHNMSFRFKQWDEVLAKDPVGRKAAVAEEIGWIESRRERMEQLWKLYESGAIQPRVTHNDTKISNMLFGHDGNVMCVIDLDTVMNSMCMNDFGDAIRTYANTGLEDDTDLSRVSMSMEMFTAYTKGYLSEAKAFLTPIEAENLALSALYITYEQVLRFLMDYIDGDNYYKTKHKEHNLERTRAQYKLLQSMEEQYDKMCEVVVNELKR